MTAPAAPPDAVPPDAGTGPAEALPLAALAELARWVEAAERAGAEAPECAARVEAALDGLRAGWRAAAPPARALLADLVPALLARRPGAGTAPAAPRRAPLPAALRRLGAERLRPGQDRAIAAALAGRDALVVMATGSGKSLCYQAPAATLSGLTVVVSPLIALMADQIGALERAGVPAATLNSTSPEHEQRETLRRARAGDVALLYLAPERAGSAALLRALEGVSVALLVVDEAHCVSEWGHDFRPDYRRVGQVREALGPRATMALTATATPAVRRDIARRLNLQDPVEVVGGFDRPNLTLDAAWVEGRGAAARTRSALGPALEGTDGGKAIVYCGTRRAAERTADALAAEGHAAVAYHAGRHDRARAQEAFAEGRARVIAATSAFGMGVNVPDVRLVVHTALPDSLEQLYQEAGRAGRDGGPARHLVLAGPAHEVASRRRITRARLDAADLDALLGRLARRAGADGAAVLGREEVDDAVAFRLAMAERVGALLLEAVPGGGRRARPLAARLAPEHREELEAQVRRELRRRHRGLDEAVAYVRGGGCRRRALLDHFGDPGPPAPLGRCCDRCAPAPDLAAAERAARGAAPPAGTAPEDLTADARRRYEALRAWRREVSRGLGVPAFRVASDRTLAGIARAAPRGAAELSAVRGVGSWLMGNHADGLLAACAGAAEGGDRE